MRAWRMATSWLALLGLAVACSSPPAMPERSGALAPGRAAGDASEGYWIRVADTSNTLEFGLGKDALFSEEDPGDGGIRFLSRVASHLAEAPAAGASADLTLFAPVNLRAVWPIYVREELDPICGEKTIQIVIVQDMRKPVRFALRSAGFLEGEPVACLLVWSPDPHTVGGLNYSIARDDGGFPTILIQEPGFSAPADADLENSLPVYLQEIAAGSRPCLAVDSRLPWAAVLPLVESLIASGITEFYLSQITVFPAPALEGDDPLPPASSSPLAAQPGQLVLEPSRLQTATLR